MTMLRRAMRKDGPIPGFISVGIVRSDGRHPTTGMSPPSSGSEMMLGGSSSLSPTSSDAHNSQCDGHEPEERVEPPLSKVENSSMHLYSCGRQTEKVGNFHCDPQSLECRTFSSKCSTKMSDGKSKSASNFRENLVSVMDATSLEAPSGDDVLKCKNQSRYIKNKAVNNSF